MNYCTIILTDCCTLSCEKIRRADSMHFSWNHKGKRKSVNPVSKTYAFGWRVGLEPTTFRTTI